MEVGMNYDDLENKALLQKLKEMFRKWYAFLPIKDLALNQRLIAEIQVIEELLSGNREFAP